MERTHHLCCGAAGANPKIHPRAKEIVWTSKERLCLVDINQLFKTHTKKANKKQEVFIFEMPSCADLHQRLFYLVWFTRPPTARIPTADISLVSHILEVWPPCTPGLKILHDWRNTRTWTHIKGSKNVTWKKKYAHKLNDFALISNDFSLYGFNLRFFLGDDATSGSACSYKQTACWLIYSSVH